MRTGWMVLAASIVAAGTILGASAPIPLWPSGAPSETAGPGDEKDTSTATSGKVAGKPVIRLGGVTNPTLQVFSPAPEKNSGVAVLVFPGGGYSILAYDLEGTEVCEWLNSIGVNCVLVKYRVPTHKGAIRYATPLQDAQRAIRIVRLHAKEWGIDAAKVGVLGFSAGGHLAAMASTAFDEATYPAADAADELPLRPDFAVLVYPAYLTETNQGDKLAPEVKVTGKAPPTFLVQAEDDSNYINSSIYYYAALKTARIPAEMHLYAKGGHGYGLRKTASPVTEWPTLAERWLRTIGMLK